MYSQNFVAMMFWGYLIKQTNNQTNTVENSTFAKRGGSDC